ncbi:hypothetical protein CERSUDRAFT_89447, partial [Gelatoporia subvermispora B]
IKAVEGNPVVQMVCATLCKPDWPRSTAWPTLTLCPTMLLFNYSHAASPPPILVYLPTSLNVFIYRTTTLRSCARLGALVRIVQQASPWLVLTHARTPELQGR